MKNYPRVGDSAVSSMKRWLLGGLLLAGLPALSLAQGVKVEYAHLDGIGNVIAVSNSAGVETESHDYLPFGEEWCGTSVCGSVKAGQSRRFTGKERDAETGLDYFGARYFASKVGRFTTVDPAYTWKENLVDPQRWNRYAYARNNPQRYVDPDGKAVLPAAALGAAIGGALGFGGSVFAQYVRDGSFANINYVDARAAALGGAVSGAIAGGTLGLSLLAEAGAGTVMVVGAGANVAGGAVTRATDSRDETRAFKGAGTEVAFDAAFGAAGGAAGFALQQSVSAQLGQMAKTRAGMLPSARAGNYGAAAGARGIAGQIGALTRQSEVGATVFGAQVTNQALPIVREAVKGKEHNE
ncbi:MAG: RHS repeat-associated core domain-containing protein [Vicinamibacteria bacterium]|nr:RHS repeat-associated core domain-containing protein [Vicinamibacteria bacterium]